MENQEEVFAQAKLIHTNPLLNKNIGDSPIDWDSSAGDPTSVANGTFDGNNFSPYFDSAETGVVLTEATSNTIGYLYWLKSYDYKKNIHVNGCFAAGDGNGADGITVFLGCNDLTIANDATNGIAVFFDEYAGNSGGPSLVKIYNNGNQVFDTYEDVPTGNFNARQYLDDLIWRQFDIIYQYKNSTTANLTVLLDGVFVCKVNVGNLVDNAGTYVGLSAYCGGDNNYHWCKKFQVKSATPWLLLNG